MSTPYEREMIKFNKFSDKVNNALDALEKKWMEADFLKEEFSKDHRDYYIASLYTRISHKLDENGEYNG